MTKPPEYREKDAVFKAFQCFVNSTHRKFEEYLKWIQKS